MSDLLRDFGSAVSLAATLYAGLHTLLTRGRGWRARSRAALALLPTLVLLGAILPWIVAFASGVAWSVPRLLPVVAIFDAVFFGMAAMFVVYVPPAVPSPSASHNPLDRPVVRSPEAILGSALGAGF